MAKHATRQVSIFLNGKQVENSIKAIAAEQRHLNNQLAGMIRGTAEYEAKATELRKVNGIIADHRKSLSGVQQGWSLAKVGLDNFVGVAAGAFTVDAVIGYGKELFNTAVKMEALEKKARVVFGETLPAINEAAKKNAHQMGLTTQEYVGAAAAIQDLLVPMGFQRKQAAAISEQLVNLSGALSEWTGGQINAAEVSDILAAALTGERERLKQLGIVLQQSDIDARLAAKGQEKLEGTLRQQAEAVASLELILEKSQDAQTSYAENADSMARRSAELSARFTEIKENLAENLIPVFELLVDAMGLVGDEINWLEEQFDSPFWKNVGVVLGSVLDTKGTLIRAFVTRDEKDKARGALNINPLSSNPILDNFLGVEAPKLSAKIEEGVKPKDKPKGKRNTDELPLTQKEIDALVAKYKEAQAVAVTLTEFTGNLQKEQSAKTLAQAEQDFETYSKLIANKKELDATYEQEKAAIQEDVRVELLTDQEAEIEALANHYANLLSLAEFYGIDTAELRRKQEEEIAAINKKYADEETQRQLETNRARLEALQGMFADFGSFVSATFDLLGGEGEKSAAFQKVATLAKIAFDTASAISSLVAASEANPLNAVTFGGAAIAQYAAGIARILSNIAQAKKILSAAPTVKQKYEGGFLDVTGEQDGRSYRARSISAPSTGLLPNYPVLFQSQATGAPVLASERGSEYFVASKDLTNPAVANYVRLIDNIVTGSGARIRQFADGGPNPATVTATTTAAATDTALMRDLANTLNTLNGLLSRGVVAIVPDNTILDISERFGKINKASGGYYG